MNFGSTASDLGRLAAHQAGWFVASPSGVPAEALAKDVCISWEPTREFPKIRVPYCRVAYRKDPTI